MNGNGAEAMLDTSATYNFVDEHMVQQLGLKVSVVPNIRGRVLHDTSGDPTLLEEGLTDLKNLDRFSFLMLDEFGSFSISDVGQFFNFARQEAYDRGALVIEHREE
nr:hypothetical protein CFP56_68871 [Quercus suber]